MRGPVLEFLSPQGAALKLSVRASRARSRVHVRTELTPVQPVSPPHPTSSPRGVGFSFVFAAPLILLVFATFLVGGNVQTLVCRSWESGELYEVGMSLRLPVPQVACPC